jgi:hypothetical protein
MALQWQIVFVCLCTEAVLCILLSIPLPEVVHNAQVKFLLFLWKYNLFRTGIIGYFSIAAMLIYQSYMQMLHFQTLKDEVDAGGVSMKVHNMSQTFYHQRNLYISSMTALLAIIILGFIRIHKNIHDLKVKEDKRA